MARLMAVKVLPSSGAGLITASEFQLRWRIRCSTWVRSILNAWAAGPLASAGMMPSARSREGSVLTIRAGETMDASRSSAGAGGSADKAAPVSSLWLRSARARFRAFCRRSISTFGRLDPGDHGQRGHGQERNDVIPAADARIEGLEQQHPANGGTQRQP